MARPDLPPNADPSITTVEVVDVPEHSRFELHDLSGAEPTTIGFMDYRANGNNLAVPHVETLSKLRGQGFGAVLMSGVVDELRESGRTITPLCPYAAGYLADRDDVADLVQ